MCVGNAPELTEEQMKMLIQQATFGTPLFCIRNNKCNKYNNINNHCISPLPNSNSNHSSSSNNNLLLEFNQDFCRNNKFKLYKQIKANATRIATKGGSFSQEVHFRNHIHARRSGGVGSQQDTFNVNPGPPLSFRFGAGSSTSSASGRRPLSPAKIGAAAVANLATPTTPYRGSSSTASTSTRRSAAHHRHSSLPLDTSGISHRLSSVTSGPESGELNRAKDYNHH